MGREGKKREGSVLNIWEVWAYLGMRVFSAEIPPTTRELRKSQNARDRWVMEISIVNCFKQPQGLPINHCKLKLGSLTYNKVIAQPFLNVDSRAVMSSHAAPHLTAGYLYPPTSSLPPRSNTVGKSHVQKLVLFHKQIRMSFRPKKLGLQALSLQGATKSVLQPVEVPLFLTPSHTTCTETSTWS